MTKPRLDIGVAHTGSIHWTRYLRSKVGLTPEEISIQDNVGVDAVKNSIAKVDAYRAIHTIDFANEAVAGTIIQLAPDVTGALARGLKAKKKIVVNGKTVAEEDHKTQIDAAQTYTELVSSIQARGGKGVSVNVQANAAAAAHTTSQTKVVGYEEMLRKISKKVKEESASKSETGTTFDDEEVEGEEEDEGKEVEGPLLLGDSAE